MRFVPVLLVLVTMTASVPALTAPAAPPEGLALPDAAKAALAAERELQGLAAGFAADAGLSAALVRAAGLGSPGALPRPAEASFPEAVARLHEVHGLLAPARVDAPPEPLASAAAPVVGAAALATALAQEALAPLSPDERAFLRTHLGPSLLQAPDAPGAPEDARRVAELAAKVDVRKMAEGAAILARAMDEFPRGRLPLPEDLASPTASVAGTIYDDGLIAISDGTTSTWTTADERVLIIDLGGSDVYDNYAGSVNSVTLAPFYVSAVLDLQGDDTYVTTVPRTTIPSETWTQGVGIMGIGLLVDVSGDDTYTTALAGANGVCSPSFFLGNAQMVYAQGVGVLGVGAVADAGGRDRFTVSNVNDANVSCHFGYAYTFAQGVGVYGGVGLLADGLGLGFSAPDPVVAPTTYSAYSEAANKFDNIAHTYAQGAGVSGIGVLVDLMGDDRYSIEAYAHVGPAGRVKGNFAYSFGQGATAATRNALDVPPWSQVRFVLDLVGLPGGACRVGAGFSNAMNHGCDLPSVGVLVDAAGIDAFTVNTFSLDDGFGCTYASWAVNVVQGAAAWPGLAALVHTSPHSGSVFFSNANANGARCPQLGVQALSYAQGYGGPVLWDNWDIPALPAMLVRPLDGLPRIGVLVNGGALPCRAQGAVCAEVDGLAALVGVPTVPWSDVMSSSASAYNYGTGCATGCVARSESWAQGVASQVASLSADYLTSSRNFYGRGVGLLVDAGGNDQLSSTALAGGNFSEPVHNLSALAYGQGAARGGVGVHVNVGGDDDYAVSAFENGVADPAKTFGQAYADDVLLVIPTFGSLPTAGVFVDVGGQDVYSEAPERGCTAGAAWPCTPSSQVPCQGNGPLLFPVSAPAIWGNLVALPCPAPVQDTANPGLFPIAEGIDWASDVTL